MLIFSDDLCNARDSNVVVIPLGQSQIIRHRPAPPPNHPKGTLASGGWEGERAGADFT